MAEGSEENRKIGRRDLLKIIGIGGVAAIATRIADKKLRGSNGEESTTEKPTKEEMTIFSKILSEFINESENPTLLEKVVNYEKSINEFSSDYATNNGATRNVLHLSYYPDQKESYKQFSIDIQEPNEYKNKQTILSIDFNYSNIVGREELRRNATKYFKLPSQLLASEWIFADSQSVNASGGDSDFKEYTDAEGSHWFLQASVKNNYTVDKNGRKVEASSITLRIKFPPSDQPRYFTPIPTK